VFSFRTLILGTSIAGLAAIVVACGPGNNGPVAGYLTPPNATVPQVGAFSSSGSVALGSNLGVPIALPGGAGVSGTLTVPVGSTVPAGTILSGSVGSSLPAGAPALSSLLRNSASGTRTTQGETSPVSGILFGSLSLSNAITVNGAVGVTFVFPAGYVASIPSSFSVYMAMYDPTRPTLGWLDRVLNCTTNGTASSITCTFTGVANIPPNVTYYWALYAVATSSTAPTPAPSVSIVPATPNPNQVSYTVTTATTTIALPTEGGISGALIPSTASASSGTTITGYGATTTAGAFLPALTNSDVNTILYVGSLTPSAATTFSGSTQVQFTAKTPSTLNPNGVYYLAMYDSSQASSGWFVKVLGPGSLSVAPGTIAFTTTLGTTLKANTQYGFALYLSNTQPVVSATVSTATQSVSIPPNSISAGGTISLPGATAGAGNVLTLTVGQSVASPIPGLSTGNGVTNVFGYGVIANTGTTNVTVSGGTTITITPVNGTIPAGNYYLAFYDTSISPPTGWFLRAAGPGVVNPSGTALTFTLQNSATFQPNTKATYGVALYQ